MATTLKDSRGFSLVQTLVGIGLMGVLALAGTNFVKQQTRTQLISSHQADLTYLVDDLKSVLSDSKVCGQNFRDKNAKSDSLEALVKNDQLMMKTDDQHPIYKDVRIKSITLSDQMSEVDFRAGTTELVLEFYQPLTQETQVRRLKLNIAATETGAIESCFTHPGVVGGQDSERVSHWGQVTGSEDIIYPHGPLLFTLPESERPDWASLGLYGHSTFQFIPYQMEACTPQFKGALVLRPGQSQLEYCSQKAQWIALQPLSIGTWTQTQFEFSSTQNLQRRFPISQQRLCTLTSWRLREGACLLRPISPGQWLVETVQEMTSPVTCRVTCYNPKS